MKIEIDTHRGWTLYAHSEPLGWYGAYRRERLDGRPFEFCCQATTMESGRRLVKKLIDTIDPRLPLIDDEDGVTPLENYRDWMISRTGNGRQYSAERIAAGGGLRLILGCWDSDHEAVEELRLEIDHAIDGVAP